MTPIDELNSGYRAIYIRIQEQTQKMRNEEIFNSISHLELSLQKFLDINPVNKQSESLIGNVFWHIGAIKGAVR